MNEKDRQALESCGVDYSEGLEKFLDEEELYCGLLVDFLAENTFDEAKRCIEEGDKEGFLWAVHAMKSATGTLSMNGLYRLCFDTVEEVRGGDIADAKETFCKAYEVYQGIADCIRRVLGDRINVTEEQQNIHNTV